MIAKLENDTVKVYDENNNLIGGIKTQSDFKNAEITIDGNKIKLSRNKWKTKVIENDNIIFNLKTNSFSGNTTILETEHKIAGVTGFKWGTKMVDKENNTLLKIRNENQFVNRNIYEIEISNEKTTDLDILLTLYGHLYGSKMKLKTVTIGVVAIGIISSGILS
jgi:hypothetical protein